MSTRIRLALQQDLRAVSYYGLFAADGQRIAGNVWTLPKSVRVDGEPRALGAAGFHPGARALAHRLQDGRILFVGYDAKTLTGLRLILFRTLLWSGAAVLIGGVALGALFGSGPLGA